MKEIGSFESPKQQISEKLVSPEDLERWRDLFNVDFPAVEKFALGMSDTSQTYFNRASGHEEDAGKGLKAIDATFTIKSDFLSEGGRELHISVRFAQKDLSIDDIRDVVNERVAHRTHHAIRLISERLPPEERLVPDSLAQAGTAISHLLCEQILEQLPRFHKETDLWEVGDGSWDQHTKEYPDRITYGLASVSHPYSRTRSLVSVVRGADAHTLGLAGEPLEEATVWWKHKTPEEQQPAAPQDFFQVGEEVRPRQIESLVRWDTFLPVQDLGEQDVNGKYPVTLQLPTDIYQVKNYTALLPPEETHSGTGSQIVQMALPGSKDLAAQRGPYFVNDELKVVSQQEIDDQNATHEKESKENERLQRLAVAIPSTSNENKSRYGDNPDPRLRNIYAMPLDANGEPCESAEALYWVPYHYASLNSHRPDLLSIQPYRGYRSRAHSDSLRGLTDIFVREDALPQGATDKPWLRRTITREPEIVLEGDSPEHEPADYSLAEEFLNPITEAEQGTQSRYIRQENPAEREAIRRSIRYADALLQDLIANGLGETLSSNIEELRLLTDDLTEEKVAASNLHFRLERSVGNIRQALRYGLPQTDGTYNPRGIDIHLETQAAIDALGEPIIENPGKKISPQRQALISVAEEIMEFIREGALDRETLQESMRMRLRSYTGPLIRDPAFVEGYGNLVQLIWANV